MQGMLRRLLSLVLIISLVLMTTFRVNGPTENPVSATEVTGPGEPETTKDPSQEWPESDTAYRSTDQEAYEEQLDLRKAGTKVYLLESKRYEAVLFGLPVHYLEEGVYREIDNTLTPETVDDGTTCYTNRANSFRVEIAGTLTEGWTAGVRKEGYGIRWSVAGLERGISATVDNGLERSEWETLPAGERRRTVPGIASRVVYPEVLPDVDLQLEVISDRIKENLILKKQGTLNRVVQTLELEGLALTRSENGTLVAVDERDGNKPVFWLPPPYAVDAAGDTTEQIEVSLEEIRGDENATRQYTLTYDVDPAWLEKAEYPVRIDPTVWTSFDSADIKDTRLTENYGNSNYYNWEYISTGTGSSSGRNYSLIRFDDLPTIGSASMIQYAALTVYKKSTSSVTSKVSVHEVTEAWVSDEVTWNSFDPETEPRPYNTQVEDWQLVGTPANGQYQWEITRIAKKWYTGGTNHGLLLKDMSSTGGYKEYHSSDAIYYPQYVPCAYFVYTNYSGLEGFWEYTSAGLGRSGTAHVNLYNGNLVYVHDDLVTTGSRLPVTVQHIFNSTTRNDNDSKMKYGKGWRTNYDQRVSYETIGGTGYYKYIDGDGTIHYFRYVSIDGTYKWVDESGLNLQFGTVSGVPYIKDKNGNKLVFYPVSDPNKPGFLQTIEDRNGNTQTIAYNTSHQISQITDGAGRVVVLERNVDMSLDTIREQTGSGTYRYTEFSYTSDRLTQITYPDGKFTRFAYDANGNLIRVEGITRDGANAGSKLELTYTTGLPYRVNYMKESASAGGTVTNGGQLSFSYGYNRTSLKDYQNRMVHYQFNDCGNTVCVTGPEGGGVYASYGTNETSGSMSKALTSSKYQKFGSNLVQNHGGEVTADWTLANGGGSTGTPAYATDQKYLGAKSIRLNKTNTTDYQYGIQWQTLVKGKTYTLSGYLKTQSVTGSGSGAYIRLGWYNGSGTFTTASATAVKGTVGWTRYSVTFTLPSDATSSSVQVGVFLSGCTGTAWFDCLQLEAGSVVNRYNIVDNADFDKASSGIPQKWTRHANCDGADIVQTSADTTNPAHHSDNRFRLYGVPDVTKTLTQDLYLSGQTGDSYVVGAWAKGSSVPLVGSRRFAITVWLDYVNISDETSVFPFSPDSDQWQYLCGAIVAKDAYQNIRVGIEYTGNANLADFDAVQFFRESFGSTYEYDTWGNLTKVTDPGQQEQEFAYSTNHDLTKYTDTNGKEFTFTYDTKHNMTGATSSEGLAYTFTYDSYGNQLTAKLGDGSVYIRSQVTYQGNGNYLDWVKDPFGEIVDYDIDSYRGILTSLTDPIGKQTNYSYDANTDALTQVSMTSDSKTMSNTYTYVDDRLTGLSHSAPGGTQAYSFLYNSLGWSTGVKLAGGSENLVSYSLQERTGRLDGLTFANDQSLSYTYDGFDNLVLTKQGTTELYRYEYDNSGNLGYQNDLVQGKEYWYEYDSLNRLGYIRSRDGSGNTTRSEYTFNAANLLSGFKETIWGTTYQFSHNYDDDGRPLMTTYNNAFSVAQVYETGSIGRLTQQQFKYIGSEVYRTEIEYSPGDQVTSITSNRIRKITYDATGTPQYLTYTYDDRGFITRVEKNGDNYSEYRYDGFGQLIRENYKWNNQSYTKLFSYDVGGNLTAQVTYAFVAGDGSVGTALDTVSYGYGDSTWKDKLTSYDGTTITYDDIGNPLSHGTWSYTWTQGRRLQQISDGSTTASYKYNDAGIRTEKTVNGVTTIYQVVGDRVTWEKKGTNNPIYYLYDASGNLWGMKYTDGNVYFYIRNGQGDIIGLVDEDGDTQVEYLYDAWGRLMGTSGNLASTVGADNPYRYRGYRYDAETGLYYLQSRYYNPEWGRFINADGQLNIDSSFVGINIFSYCINNPVSQIDPDGRASYKSDYMVEKDENGIVQYRVTTTIYTCSISLIYMYTIRNDGVISFDFSNNNYWALLLRGLGKTLAEAMYKVTKSINNKYLWGRTIGGLNTELQLHYVAYRTLNGSLKNRAAVADMGSLVKGNPGYDSNAFIWEGVNVNKIVAKFTVFGCYGAATTVRDIARYIE